MPNLVELDDVLASYAGTGRLNSNFDKIEAAFNDVLWADGSVSLLGDLDFNGFAPINIDPAFLATLQGATGPQGPQGPAGVDGVDGVDGDDGLGVPAGGTTGQVLAKLSNANNDTQWVTPSAGAVSDAVYGAGWNADTVNAPSKNAVYDKIETVVASVSANTANFANYLPLAGGTLTGNLLFGTTSGFGTLTPLKISLGGTFSTVAGENPKVEVFNDGTNIYGFGVSNNQLDYIVPAGATHNFYIVGTGKVGQLTVNGLTPKIQTVASNATVTPTFANDLVTITAQAAALNLANPTGTAENGKGVAIRIKDNGTARAITYGTQYRAIGVTLPTTTVANKTLYLGMIYNSTDTKWDVVSVAQEA